jgi:hypothetical protein
MYEDFYKVDSFGLENIPKEGRCLSNTQSQRTITI